MRLLNSDELKEGMLVMHISWIKSYSQPMEVINEEEKFMLKDIHSGDIVGLLDRGEEEFGWFEVEINEDFYK